MTVTHVCANAGMIDITARFWEVNIKAATITQGLYTTDNSLANTVHIQRINIKKVYYNVH
jgi:hypothetical protein